MQTVLRSINLNYNYYQKKNLLLYANQIKKNVLLIKKEKINYIKTSKKLSSYQVLYSKSPNLEEFQLTPIISKNGIKTEFPDAPGVYAIYDQDENIQYISLSRKISASINYHLKELPEEVGKIRYRVMENATKEILMGEWKQWMEDTIKSTGNAPPGNLPGETKWKPKHPSQLKNDLKLTTGKGIENLTCSISDLIASVIKEYKIVAFIKGTRHEPSCGFSYQVIQILNKIGLDYEVINVMDEIHNPGLREDIKNFTNWPTIPQIFINGEFIGGSDILHEMNENGDLKKMLNI